MLILHPKCTGVELVPYCHSSARACRHSAGRQPHWQGYCRQTLCGVQRTGLMVSPCMSLASGLEVTGCTASSHLTVRHGHLQSCCGHPAHHLSKQSDKRWPCRSSLNPSPREWEPALHMSVCTPCRCDSRHASASVHPVHSPKMCRLTVHPGLCMSPASEPTSVLAIRL